MIISNHLALYTKCFAAAVPKSFSINVATAQAIAKDANKKMVSRKLINSDTRVFIMIK